MTNFVYHAAILGIISSIVTIHSGSASDELVKKSGFDSSYHGYLGEYSAGKALGELHSFGESSQIAPEHGNHFDEGESHFGESFGHQTDDGHSSHFESYSGGFESSKYPSEGESHHYTGGGSSEIGLGEEDHQQEQHQFEHHNYQFDEPAKSSDFKGFHTFQGTQIVPYIGNEESEQNEEQSPKYSGQENSQENEVTKEPSHGHSYEAPEKVAVSSYSYSSSKASAKVPASSYSHSYDVPKIPSSSYSSSYDAANTKSPSSSFESIKAPGLAHEYSLGSYGIKHQHHSIPAVEAPSKIDIIPKYKSSGLKSYHSPPQKNIMSINHGKGGYSFSSLYRA